MSRCSDDLNHFISLVPAQHMYRYIPRRRVLYRVTSSMDSDGVGFIQDSGLVGSANYTTLVIYDGYAFTGHKSSSGHIPVIVTTIAFHRHFQEDISSRAFKQYSIGGPRSSSLQ